MTPKREALIAKTLEQFEDFGQRAVSLFAQRAEEEGMTVLGLKALHVVQRGGPNIKLGEVAEAIHVPPSSMTGIADRLVREGLIERVPSPTDRRSVVVSITPKGEAAMETANAGIMRDLQTVMSSFRDEEIETLNALLGEFVHGIERELTKRSGVH